MAAHPLSPDLPQRWRLRQPSTGREVVITAAPETRYVDRDTGERLRVVGRLVPLAPSPSRLLWSPEHLRFCPYCDQLVAKNLNHCPYDGRPLPPLSPRSPIKDTAESDSAPAGSQPA